MKKLLSLVLCLVLVLSAFTLVSCKKEVDESPAPEESSDAIATTPLDGGYYLINIPNAFVLSSETGDENGFTKFYMNMQTGESIMISGGKNEILSEFGWSAPTVESILKAYSGDEYNEPSNINVESGDDFYKVSFKLTRKADGVSSNVTVFSMVKGPDENNILYSIGFTCFENSETYPIANALAPAFKK